MNYLSGKRLFWFWITVLIAVIVQIQIYGRGKVDNWSFNFPDYAKHYFKVWVSK